MPDTPIAEVAAAVQRCQAPRVDAVLALLHHARYARGVAWHPTGFVVAQLGTEGRRSLRLHVWPRGERCYGEPLWPAHDHIWTLYSHVLVGTVRSEDYAVREDQTGSHRRYFVDYVAGTRRSLLLADALRVSRLECGLRVVAAGGHYTVPAGAFHASSAPQGALVATLVVTLSGSRTRPSVLGPADGPPQIAVTRTPVAADDWHAMLGEVAERYAMSAAH